MQEIKIMNETTKFPLQVIGEAAGICWNSDISDVNKNIKRAKDCILSGHGRVLEFVDIQLVISGYSARVIREWYTHIGGGPTRLQESTRYVDEKGFDFVTPDKISNNETAMNVYQTAMQNIRESYRLLIDCGVPREDAAMVLPLGMTTKIVDKRNLRNLVEMAHQRLCTRAYWEYRELMKSICKELSEYSDEWKWIVDNLMKPKCEVNGVCTESKSCGRVK